MGVAYQAIGGIGIEITDEMINKMIDLGMFAKTEWNEDPDGCLSEIGLLCANAGSYYSGNVYWYWLVAGDTLTEVNDNSNDFLHKLNQIGFKKNVSDLKVIQDLLIF